MRKILMIRWLKKILRLLNKREKNGTKSGKQFGNRKSWTKPKH